MPKRIIDGEALWTSDKLKSVEPPRYRAEYANLIPLALANGSFECNPKLIWMRVYAYNREDITESIVEDILEEFERVGLLVRWKLGEGKTWGYWVGINKCGRLPGAKRIAEGHERIGEEPPPELLCLLQDGSNNSRQRTGYVYFVGASRTRKIKIGYAANPSARLAELQIGSPDKLTILGVKQAPRELERQLHARFSELRSNGEWFSESQELLKLITSECTQVIEDKMDANGIHIVDICGIHTDSTPIPKPKPNPKGGVGGFRVPTREEVFAYMVEIGLDQANSEADKFLNYHSERGWVPKGHTRQMSDWKAAVRTWKGNYALFRSSHHSLISADAAGNGKLNAGQNGNVKLGPGQRYASVKVGELWYENMLAYHKCLEAKGESETK